MLYRLYGERVDGVMARPISHLINFKSIDFRCEYLVLLGNILSNLWRKMIPEKGLNHLEEETIRRSI